MRKSLLFSLALVFSTVVLAQGVHFGVGGGMAISRGSYEPSAGLDRRVFAGFDGGALVEIGVCEKFMLQAEVNFSIVGVELNNGDK